MKTVTPALVDLLRSRDPVLAFDLYQFTMPGDTVLYYGSADVPIVYNGNTYGGSVRWDRSQIDLKAGLEADSLTVNAYATPDDLVNGVPFHQFLRQGGFDNAYLLLQRAYYPAPLGGWFVDGWLTPPGWLIAGQAIGPPTGVVWLFSGLVTEIITGGLKAQIKIDSHLYTLDRKLPRNLYQHLCNHVLYGQGCGLNGALYAVQGQAQAGSTIFQIVTNLTGLAAGYFSLGKLQMTSGALQGTWIGIQSQVGGTGSQPATLILTPPLLAAPAPGDTFTAWPGCNRALSTCINKFNNAGNFRGFPWIPVPETAE
ncbi:MAG: DUF2163 domain-containing protein [Desulfobaccales bacterium]|jgi:hypothetical protein